MLYGYSILPLMIKERLVLGAWTVMHKSVLMVEQKLAKIDR